MSNREYILTERKLFKKYNIGSLQKTNLELLTCIFSYAHTIRAYNSSIQDFEKQLDVFLSIISEK